jgi:hypothetical protein
MCCTSGSGNEEFNKALENGMKDGVAGKDFRAMQLAGFGWRFWWLGQAPNWRFYRREMRF